MRDLIAIEVLVLALAAYVAAMYGLTLAIGGWAFAVLVPTVMPMIWAGCWLGDHVAFPDKK